MRIAALLILGLLAPHQIQSITHIQQGRAPFCAAAAGLMAASRLGPVPDLKAFVRTLPVSADGIPFLELSDALVPLGLAPRVVQLDPPTLRALIQQDVPVILAVQAGPRRHAVLAFGVDAQGIDIADPALPTPVRWSMQTLVARWSARQAVILPKRGGIVARDPRWRAADRRYRALEWALRAERVSTPGPDMLALYDAAVAADPGIAPIRFNRGMLRQSLGLDPCADFSAARAGAGGVWPALAQAAQAAGCPVAP